jgi:hypothetical protein
MQQAQRQQQQPARSCSSKHKQPHPLLVPAAAAASLDYLMQLTLGFPLHSRRCQLAALWDLAVVYAWGFGEQGLAWWGLRSSPTTVLCLEPGCLLRHV